MYEFSILFFDHKSERIVRESDGLDTIKLLIVELKKRCVAKDITDSL